MDDLSTSQTQGICYLAGAGPGDPGLLTVRTQQVLRRADCVIYDALVSDAILQNIPESAERIYAGKRANQHTLTQDQINALLIEKTSEGKIVVRLKGGDPMLFGRGGEEAEALENAGLRWEFIPGITSALAGPLYAGIPVTHREHASVVTIFTGHEDPTKPECSLDYAQLAKTGGTLVMLMGVGRIAVISTQLQEGGLAPETPVALVRWATTGKQQTLTGTLSDIAQKIEESGFSAPAVAVIGSVAGIRDKLNWFEKRPLFGKRIVVTRTRKQASQLSSRLLELGADVVELPTIRITPPSDPQLFDELVRDSHTYDWLVFTSPNGVEAFFTAFFQQYDDARSLGNARIAAIGPATAARVRQYHLAVDLVPEEFVAESVLKAFIDQGGVENLKILIARAETARDLIPDSLTKMGGIVDVIPAYRTVPEDENISGQRQLLEEEGADMITFTSSSTAENFELLKIRMPHRPKIASIGPITSQTLQDLGHTVDAEAEQYDIPGLVEAILKFYKK